MDDYLIDIDRYLNGEMNEDEKKTFEEQLQNNSELSDNFKLQKDMRLLYSDDEWSTVDRSILNTDKAKTMKSYLRSEELASIKETIVDVITENKSTFSRKSFIQKLAVAASILLVSTISYFSIKSSNTDFSTIINEEYENIPSLINRSDNADELLINGQQYFENRDYKNAIIAFSGHQKKSLETGKTNSLSYIYNGLSFLAVNDYDNAIAQFNLLEKTESFQSKKVDWYKALVYLKQDNKNLLKSVLTKITSDSSNYNYKKAEKLLNKLD